MVAGVVLAQYTVSDHMAEAHVIVNLCDQGWADQNDVARAFGCTSRTVRRHQERFAEKGLAALGHGGGFPRGRSRLRASRTRLVGRLKSEGLSNRAIAAQIGVTEKSVRKLVRRMGWTERTPEQESLALGRSEPADPNLSAFPGAPPAAEPGRPPPKDSPPVAGTSKGANPNLSAFAQTAFGGGTPPVSLDTDPADRGGDRLLAYLGLLDDAAPLFRAGTRVPRAPRWEAPHETGHPALGRWPPDTHRHVAAGPLGAPGGASHVRALAPGELLQVPP